MCHSQNQKTLIIGCRCTRNFNKVSTFSCVRLPPLYFLLGLTVTNVKSNFTKNTEKIERSASLNGISIQRSLLLLLEINTQRHLCTLLVFH